MYLVTLYFDAYTNKIIQSYIDSLKHNFQIPPHLTLLTFDCDDEDEVIKRFNEIDLSSFPVEIVGYGSLPSNIIYLLPVYSLKMQETMKSSYFAFESIENIHFSKYYNIDTYLPHITIAKKLKQSELSKGLDQLVYTFHYFSGKVERIELSKNQPFEVLKTKILK